MANFTKKEKPAYLTLLLDEFSSRRGRNSSYSLRAFARDLGISTTCLSDVLSARRGLSRKNALKVADRLLLSPAQTNHLLNQIGFKADKASEAREFLQLADDVFQAVSDWYYFAILSLCKLGEVGADARPIAQRLGISDFEARSAIERLKRLNLIEWKDNKFVKTTTTLSTTRDVPSSAIRKYHKQNLRLAEISMERDPIDRRCFSSITFPGDPDKLAEAKDLIMEFKRKIARLMETSRSKEVYTLAIQLFPVSKEAVQ